VAHPVVGRAFGGVAERVVGLLQGGELRLCAWVVVQVGMVLPNLVAKRILDVFLRRVLVDVHQVVEVLRHGSPVRSYTVR
jgi:hypothetical protein